MRRKVPTGKVTPITGAPATLLIDYEGADDFLHDYEEHLERRECVVQTESALAEGTPVHLGIAFPGLLQAIVLEGVVREEIDESTTRIELLASGATRLATIVARIRANDRRVVARVVRVLIAEDNAHLCELVKSGLAAATRRDLKDMAFSFDTASDGGTALALLKQTTFDAVLVDIYLPVVDGGTVIRQIRTTLGMPDLPIIALSAGGAAARDEGLKAGASRFLEKPIRLRSIVETLRELVPA